MEYKDIVTVVHSILKLLTNTRLIDYFLHLSAAGDAFCKAAKIKLNQLHNKHEAGSQYVEAANCYKKSDYDGKSFFCL